MSKSGLRRVVNTLLAAVLLGILVFGTTRPASAAGIIYVKSNAVGANNGTSWANAYKSLRKAISVAASGQQIWVAMGTYKPTAGTDRTQSFVLKNGVAIYGGFAGTETLLGQRNPPVNITTLSGDIGTPNDNSDNSYHVLDGGGTNSTAILDGFSVTGGNASSFGTTNGSGGGMTNVNSSPTLRNLTFSSNAAVNGGGGMQNEGSSPRLTNVIFGVNTAFTGGGMWNFSSAPVLSHVTFVENSAADGGGISNVSGGNPVLSHVIFNSNTASSSGGGMYDNGGVPKLTNVSFDANSAIDGGGLYNSGTSPHLAKVAFNNNTATHWGGGIYNTNSSPVLLDVSFSGNSASYGGGMANSGGGAPSVSRATFSGNSAVNDGGGIFNSTSSPTLTNVTLSGNSATYGGAISNEAITVATLINVTISGNSGLAGAGMNDIDNSSTNVRNSLFWNNSAGDIAGIGASLTIDDSIVGSGCPVNAACNNVSGSDPVLGPLQANGGFTQTMALLAGSAAIDAGNMATCAPTDQRRVPRQQGQGCDMGAYEVRAIKFVSQAANDGQVLETAKGSGVGGAVNSGAGTFRVGDDASDRGYRSFLSFNTAAIPDAASIVLARVTVTQASMPVGDPFHTLGTLQADLANPFFGSGLGLAASDWQAGAAVSAAGTLAPDGSLYWAALSSAGRSHVSKTATTQIRLRFALADSNSHADYISLFSGEASTAGFRPALTIYYNP